MKEDKGSEAIKIPKIDCPLFNSFTFVKGIGPRTESTLNELGITCWKDVIKKKRPKPFPKQIWDSLRNSVDSIIKALNILDVSQLTDFIPKTQHWKMIPTFIDRVAYLDIETTGLSPQYSHITTIAVYDGEEIYDFIKGENLYKFPAFISKFPAISTFYGKVFDIPFIEHEMGIKFTQIHFDVCFLLKRLKIKGGLKKIERQFGISRGNLADLDGSTAVMLWHKFKKSQKREYLETLLAYNNEDVINLEYLLYQAYNLLLEREKNYTNPLEFPEKKVTNPFQADRKVMDEMIRITDFYS